MNKKQYNVIYADPPWQYGSKSKVNDYQGESTHGVQSKLEEAYDTMTIKEIKGLNVKEMIADDCACFLWVTDSHLKEGIEVLEAWGFKYKTIAFNWIKKTSKGNTFVNVAPWTLKSSEICLLGTRGAMTKYKKNNSVRQLIEAERTKHSKKPLEVADRIVELFGDVPKLEMFARDKKESWDVWGNEVENSILLNKQ